MPAIDADAHVIETERTWEFMDEEDLAFKPRVLVATDTPDNPRKGKEFWSVDGRTFPRRTNIGLDTSEEAREMADIRARLAHMDELGVDVQVLFPTLFLTAVSDRPQVDVAMCKAYNRWLADIWKQANGRLRWAVAPPLLDMDKTIEQLHFGKQNGACAVFVRYIEAADTVLTEPYFYPLYEEASRLNMPICIHAGAATLQAQAFTQLMGGLATNKLGCIGAFEDIAVSQIPDRFPDLRWGFVEVCSQWVPYVLHDMRSRARGKVAWWKDRLLKEKRFYVACQTDDDLPYVLQYAGEDNLVIGSDYGHNDTASELDALRNLKRKGEVDPAVIDKIMWDNARALYGI